MNKKIIVYTTPTCVFCPLVKKFLDEKGVEYEEIDVSSNSEEMEKMKEKTGQMGVPVVLIGDDIVVGFDKKKIEELLEK